jgi:hypothetical protein
VQVSFQSLAAAVAGLISSRQLAVRYSNRPPFDFSVVMNDWQL